jgi:uncharacterized membrane protein
MDPTVDGAGNEAQERERYERSHDPSRVLALSDGVFAIILTLLVLEIHVPDLDEGQSLRSALEEVRPSFSAFLISFVVVAIAWAGHRDLFALILRTDRMLVWLNVTYLLPLSVLPFGASLLSRFETEPNAIGIYGSLLVAIALTRLAIWLYATGKNYLLFAPIDVASRRTGVALVALPGLAYFVAVVLAASAPKVSLGIFYSVPVLYFAGVAFARASSPPTAAERDFT